MKWLLLILLFPLTVFADEIPSQLASVLGFLAPHLEVYSLKYPWLSDILGIMVMARLVMKPIMSALLQISKDTQLKQLDWVAGFSDHKIYKIVAFILDWMLSIKLPKKK